MLSKMICGKCNGYGYITHYEEKGMWSERCGSCNGQGVLGNIIIDDIAIDFQNNMVCIPKEEYEELLEYKSMYERLCT